VPAVVGLDDPIARNPEVSGAKAAGLALARAAGLPVLDGFVIPVSASEPAIARGAAALQTGGTGAARRMVIGFRVDDVLLADIDVAATRLRPPYIVRSSSPAEEGGEWSGAFTSVPEVRPGEITKALRSVWATTFALDVVERFHAADLTPGSVPMGVLVQPEVSPEFGGTAVVRETGAVSIRAVKGSPRDLLAGWERGVGATVVGDDVVGSEAVDLIGGALLRSVAHLGIRVHDDLGRNLIEWAVIDGGPIILQVQTSAASGWTTSLHVPAALAHPFALEFIRLALRFPGALGEELVLGWLPGMAELAPASQDQLGVMPNSELRLQANELASELTRQAWGGDREEAQRRASHALRRLRGDHPNESIEALRDLMPVDPTKGARLLAIHDRLAASGRPHRHGIDRWEPVLAGIISLQGAALAAEPGVDGIGAGRLVWVDSPHDTARVRPRDIIVMQYPLPNYSPLLWDAAGVITLGGSSAAHLFEVARSLTVPAVVCAEAAAHVHGSTVLGVLDGSIGRVSILPGRSPAQRP
jgi:hypothetical protein